MSAVAIALLIAAAPTINLPNVETWTVEQRIDYLAEAQARFAEPVNSTLYENPDVRAEIRRIGFLKGCQLAQQARRDALDQHFPELKAGYAEAIRKAVSEDMLKSVRFITFDLPPLRGAKFRLGREAERSMASEFSATRIDMTKRFVELSGPLPTNSDPAANRVTPRADVAGALGIAGDYDLDNPGFLGLACAEATIDPAFRPQISGGNP